MKIRNCDLAVSVIIPTFNRCNILPRAIDSALSQTFPDIEVIVVDNGSTDDTPSMIKTKYPQIRFFIESRRGVSAARNRGILNVNGNWIALLDSDDEWLPEKLEKQISFSKRDPITRFIHTNEVWYRDGKILNQKKKHEKKGGHLFIDSLKSCCISPSSALIKRSVFEDIGNFDEQLQVCEDYDFWLRVAAKEKVSFIDEVLTIKHGGHQDQLSKKYWGLDLFRIQSLEKIISFGDLSVSYEREAVKVLREKLNIVINGAKKRDNISIIKKYSPKLEYWNDIATSKFK